MELQLALQLVVATGYHWLTLVATGCHHLQHQLEDFTGGQRFRIRHRAGDQDAAPALPPCGVCEGRGSTCQSDPR